LFGPHGAIYCDDFIYQAAGVGVETEFHISNRQIAEGDRLPFLIACGLEGTQRLLGVLDAFGKVCIDVAKRIEGIAHAVPVARLLAERERGLRGAA